MANDIFRKVGFHAYETAVATIGVRARSKQVDKFSYTFSNFFHPFVGEVITKLNTDSLDGALDATWQDSLKWGSFEPNPAPVATPFEQLWANSKLPNAPQSNYFRVSYSPTQDEITSVDYEPKTIDVSAHGAYANYNWELFFHIPLTIAVHLSKSRRFREAQTWFHRIVDFTEYDAKLGDGRRFWKFLAFRQQQGSKTIGEIVRILSADRASLSPTEKQVQDEVLQGYNAIRDKPFQPHAVARTRHIAYQYAVVMKYLDNLISWGDDLFLQDTLETINEATQLYVLAANVLGERPQEIPPLGKVRSKSFAQLKKEGLGPIGDAIGELEGLFPLNLAVPSANPAASDADALFGIGRTLYFCVPRNDKMLGYWDTVADRLFKIRHCMNIAGVVRPLALFDPPIDPGMLVKAAAAGIDIGNIVNGLNQPIGPVRSLVLIQKALEMVGELRIMGNAVLSAQEKGQGEHLALLRQTHEIKIQQMAQDVRFLQWHSAQESTKSLLTSRASALERLRYYERLLGLPTDPNAPDTLALDHRELTEENFDEMYVALVGLYDKPVARMAFPKLALAGDSSPAQQSGAVGSGRLYLNLHEGAELNQHLPDARDSRLKANVSNNIGSVLTFIPDLNIDLAFWGVGGSSGIFGGKKLSDAAKLAAEILQTIAGYEQDQAGLASRTAGHERRADEWLLQHNAAAHELMLNGRQILTSLIAEQIAHHEYLNTQQQIANSQEVDQFLHEKFTNEELYFWMQGELSRLYYEYYRFAFDTARRAEKTMKQELMRPELDAQDFVQFNYWDAGRKGLLAGEALYLDVKRMELAHHDNSKRELELTRHVSLRQLNPMALLALKATGTCQVIVPEWLFDMDCPGHYMRRIKSVALSIPCVTGPYTGVNCTLSLLRSSVRRSQIVGAQYARDAVEDDRFVDYVGAVQTIVTSSGQNDSGLFETNLRDERFLPFEGAGAISMWKLDLPAEHRAFDYDTIADVILHIRYTARQGLAPATVSKAVGDQFANQSDLALFFSLRHDFPSEWANFINGSGAFSAKVRSDYFPYFAQRKTIVVTRMDLYGQDVTKHEKVGEAGTATVDLADKNKLAFTFTSAVSALLTRTMADAHLIVKYDVT